MDCDQDQPQRSNWRGGCVITTEGVCLDAGRKWRYMGYCAGRRSRQANYGKRATRSFTLDGARSIEMPTVIVIYEIRLLEVVIHDAKFERAKFAVAGRA
jgi:hypothetical protein